jgi:hypothetical protein
MRHWPVEAKWRCSPRKGRNGGARPTSANGRWCSGVDEWKNGKGGMRGGGEVPSGG